MLVKGDGEQQKDSMEQIHNKENTCNRKRPQQDNAIGPASTAEHAYERTLQTESRERTSDVYDVTKRLATFWPRKHAEINQLDKDELRRATRNQELPLARIKKIMKLDDNVKQQMISAEAPMLLAMAAQMFVQELTLRSWYHTEESKRKTLQKADISHGYSSTDKFDFLIDIVPRPETRRETPCLMNVPMQSVPMAAVPLEAAQMVDGRVFLQQQNTSQNTNSNLVQLIQVRDSDGAIASGSVLQATQIGQPIQLPVTESGQPVQVIAVGLPNGEIQHFQVQLPHATE